MAKLTLTCVFHGEDKRKCFLVDVSVNDTVNTLKILIKNINPNLNVSIREIDLYQVSFPLGEFEACMSTFDLQRAVPLIALDLISELFVDVDKKPTDVHVIVVTPTDTGEPAPKRRRTENSAPDPLNAQQQTLPIYNGRPTSREGPPLTIYDEAFAYIVDGLRNLPSREVCEELVPAVGELFSTATNLYKSEALRQSQTNTILGRLLDISFTKHQARTVMGKNIAESDPVGHEQIENSEGTAIVAQVEYNLEPGVGGDTLLQCTLTFQMHILLPQYSSIRNVTCCPCIFVAISGPYMLFAGAVLADIFVVQPFTDYLYLGGDFERIRDVSRIFSIFREAISLLKAKYQQIQPSDKVDTSCTLPQPIYNDQGPPRPLNFTRRFIFSKWSPGDHRRSLFRARYGDDEVIVKFCQTYSTHAHQILSDAGFAPKLFYSTRLRGGMWMIVMEYLSGAGVSLADEFAASEKIPDTIRKKIGGGLQLLHEKNLVFGDLRRPNVLLSMQEPFLIDFEWVGEHSKGRYPPQMNMVDIRWPSGVGPNVIMDKAHDLQMLEWL